MFVLLCFVVGHSFEEICCLVYQKYIAFVCWLIQRCSFFQTSIACTYHTYTCLGPLSSSGFFNTKHFTFKLLKFLFYFLESSTRKLSVHLFVCCWFFFFIRLFIRSALSNVNIVKINVKCCSKPKPQIAILHMCNDILFIRNLPLVAEEFAVCAPKYVVNTTIT